MARRQLLLNASVFISPSKEAPTGYGLQRVVHGPVVPPASGAIECTTTWYGDAHGEEPVAEKIWKEQQFIHFYGFISYHDVFGNPHKTTFRYRWYIIFDEKFDKEPFAIWSKIGPPEDNSET